MAETRSIRKKRRVAPAFALAFLLVAVSAPAGQQQKQGTLDRALQLIERGELEAARSLLERLVATETDDPGPHYYLGSVLLDVGDVDQAVVHLERAATLDPGLGAVHFNLGLAYQKLGRDADAARSFAVAWSKEPDNPVTALALGRARIAAGNFDEAIEPLERASALAPGVPSPLFHLGVAQLRAGNPEAAFASLTRAVGGAPDDPQMRFFQGVAAREAGRRDTAIEAFEEVRAHPKGSRQLKALAMSELGRIAAGEGRVRDAVALLEEALQIPGGLAEEERRLALRARGEALLQGGFLEESVAALQQALVAAVRGETFAIWLSLGQAHRLLAQHEEALKAYEQAVAADPRVVEPWLRRAEVELELNAVASATESALQAVRLRAEDARAHYLLGRALLSAGDYRAATASLEQAIQLDPELEGAFYALGNALARQGDTERARRILARFRELEAHRAARHEALGHLTTANRQGLKLLREGRYEEAASWFRQIVADAPESPVGYLNLGIALLRSGRPAEAVSVLESGRSRAEEAPMLYRYLAQAYGDLGREADRQAAEQTYDRLRSP